MQRLKQVFIETLGVPENTDFSQLAYGKDPLWDSVAHMNLVASLENTFDVMFSTQDVIGMSSYPVALGILEKHGVAVDAEP